MLAALVAATASSACCVGPLLLVSLGIGGAWVSHLPALSPWRAWFVIASLLLLADALRRLYLRPAACAPGTACAMPSTRRRSRFMFWMLALLTLALLLAPSLAPFFV